MQSDLTLTMWLLGFIATDRERDDSLQAWNGLLSRRSLVRSAPHQAFNRNKPLRPERSRWLGPCLHSSLPAERIFWDSSQRANSRCHTSMTPMKDGGMSWSSSRLDWRVRRSGSRGSLARVASVPRWNQFPKQTTVLGTHGCAVCGSWEGFFAVLPSGLRVLYDVGQGQRNHPE